MKSVNMLAMCTVLCAIGCEPKLELQLERHGEAYEFDLYRKDEMHGFGAESFDVMEART